MIMHYKESVIDVSVFFKVRNLVITKVELGVNNVSISQRRIITGWSQLFPISGPKCLQAQNHTVLNVVGNFRSTIGYVCQGAQQFVRLFCICSIFCILSTNSFYFLFPILNGEHSIFPFQLFHLLDSLCFLVFIRNRSISPVTHQQVHKVTFDCLDLLQNTWDFVYSLKLHLGS